LFLSLSLEHSTNLSTYTKVRRLVTEVSVYIFHKPDESCMILTLQCHVLKLHGQKQRLTKQGQAKQKQSKSKSKSKSRSRRKANKSIDQCVALLPIMFIFCTLAWLCVFSLQFQCPKTIDVAAVFAQEITKGDDSFFFSNDRKL